MLHMGPLSNEQSDYEDYRTSGLQMSTVDCMQAHVI